MKTRLVISFIAFFIVGCANESISGNQVQNGIVDDYSARINKLLQESKPREFNGVVLITKGGELKYSNVHGYSDLNHKTPLTLDDKFRIQSNSKQITAVIALREFEKGNLDLKVPIRKYLPELSQAWADIVNVHQLLNMSSGIASLNEPLLFEAGTRYHYSNPAYFLLGKIIQRVTGKTFVEAANSLFDEIGMENTFCFEEDMKENENSLVKGYRVFEGVPKLVVFHDIERKEYSYAEFIPAGGIVSNAADLNLWDTKLHNGQLLSNKAYQLMTSYNIKGKNGAYGKSDIGYGYGVMIQDGETAKNIGHAGRGTGFVNLKFYIPESDTDVIVLENVYNENEEIVYYFENKIREIVLNSSLVDK